MSRRHLLLCSSGNTRRIKCLTTLVQAVEEITIATLHVVTMTGTTIPVIIITCPGVRIATVTLGHVVPLVTVTVDVVHVVVATPPPIAMIGPTPAPVLVHILQLRVIAAVKGAGMKVGHLASLIPTRITEVGVGSCLTLTIGRDDILLWLASPFADYLV